MGHIMVKGETVAFTLFSFPFQLNMISKPVCEDMLILMMTNEVISLQRDDPTAERLWGGKMGSPVGT